MPEPSGGCGDAQEDQATKKTTTYPGGEPCGFVIELENGFKLSRMGDTGLFGGLRSFFASCGRRRPSRAEATRAAHTAGWA